MLINMHILNMRMQPYQIRLFSGSSRLHWRSFFLFTTIYQQTLVKKYIIIDSMKVTMDKIMYEKNMSVRQVSIVTGVSKSTINRIMNGQVSPSLDTLECIAQGLHVHITDLFESEFK